MNRYKSLILPIRPSSCARDVGLQKKESLEWLSTDLLVYRFATLKDERFWETPAWPVALPERRELGHQEWSSDSEGPGSGMSSRMSLNESLSSVCAIIYFGNYFGYFFLKFIISRYLKTFVQLPHFALVYFISLKLLIYSHLKNL